MSAPAAPLEKAVEALRRALDGAYGESNLPWRVIPLQDVEIRSLLAALDADKRPCEPGVICPTCVALEDAESALKEIRLMTDGFKSWTLEDKVCEVARRYFAEKGER